MEYKKYAPLIGKKLTWDIIEELTKDIKSQLVAEQHKAKHIRYKAKEQRGKPVHTEDDGS